MGSGGDPRVQKFLLFTVAPACSLRCFADECGFFFDLEVYLHCLQWTDGCAWTERFCLCARIRIRRCNGVDKDLTNDFVDSHK